MRINIKKVFWCLIFKVVILGKLKKEVSFILVFIYHISCYVKNMNERPFRYLRKLEHTNTTLL